MNISYITTYDAGDVHQWSGLGYYIGNALEQQGATLDLVGNVQTSPSKYLELKHRIYNKLGKRYLFDRVPSLVRSNALQAQSRIKPNADIIFAPSSLPINYINIRKPKVFYTDATFAGMLNFYPYFTNVAAESIRNGNKLEQAAFDNCDLAIYASDWAAKTAIDNYKVDPAKVKVVPFGANIQSNRTLSDINSIAQSKETATCHLLFLGVEWERKGGDVTLAVARLLNEQGVPTVLHIAGLHSLPFTGMPPYVVDHGFISKSTPAGVKQLEDLFAKCHFLLVPSQAEAYGLVYCEANSFGMPAIATNVGGIPTIIKNDVNGYTFALTDSAQQYADYIAAQFTDAGRYAELARSSYNEYATRLNWDAAGKSIMALLKAL